MRENETWAGSRAQDRTATAQNWLASAQVDSGLLRSESGNGLVRSVLAKVYVAIV